MPTGVLHLKEVDTDKITLDGILSVSGEARLKGPTVIVDNALSVGTTTTLAADTTATNVNLTGTLSVSGQTTIGGDILPDTNDAYDIGSPEFKIRDLYVSNNSIWVGDDMKISNVNGSLKFRKRKTDEVPKAILDAGANAGHANEQATADAALAHAGVANVTDMKLQHWFKFMRTLNAAAKLTDIFRDNDDDYEETSASDAWKEIADANKIYANSMVGVGTSDPDTALHVKGSLKVESEDDGFQLIRSTVGASDPQLIIDTKNFGVDQSIEDMTGQNCTKFTKLYRVYGTNSEGYGRDWYWGLANDEYTNISLAVGGESGGNDPDLAFTFTTASELYCNKVYAALGGNADTATRLATPRKINGVDFDGTQDITIDTGTVNTRTITKGQSLSNESENFTLEDGENRIVLNNAQGSAGFSREYYANFNSGVPTEVGTIIYLEINSSRTNSSSDGVNHRSEIQFDGIKVLSTGNNYLGANASYSKSLKRMVMLTTNGWEDVTQLKHGDNGNVGIGTDNPSVQLHIKGTSPITLSTPDGPSYADYGQLVITDTTSPSSTSTLGNLKLGYDASTGGFGTGFIQCVNPNKYNGPLVIQPYGGNVGIGTSTPESKLHLYGDNDVLYLQDKTNDGGIGIKFTSESPNSGSPSQFGYLRYHHKDDESYSTKNCFKFSTTESTETVAVGGCLHIGVDGKDDGQMTSGGGSGRRNLFIQSTYGGNTSQAYGWWIGGQNEQLRPDDNDLYFAAMRNGSIRVAGHIADQGNNTRMNFTGQHRTFVKDIPTNQLDDKEGLIVVANQNEFIRMSGGVACGNDAITINESLPVVSLSKKSMDKRCFGVLSTTEDPEVRKEVHGNFASIMHKEKGDTRVFVNSVGEGGVWVSNMNGSLESGDYITTSDICGYGMKQDDDLLHNYTVAKILMDCNFQSVRQMKRVIKKEQNMVDYWVKYRDIKITEEEFETLPALRRKFHEGYYRIDQIDVREEDPGDTSFVHESRRELVNVLDEDGQFQWEDSVEMEDSYKIRYILPDGTQITKSEYDRKVQVNEEVYMAAFVGCTYHCG